MFAQTDHMPVFITFPVVSTIGGEYIIKSFRDHSKECLGSFERSLINFAGTYEVGNDINNKFVRFRIKTIQKCIILVVQFIK